VKEILKVLCEESSLEKVEEKKHRMNLRRTKLHDWKMKA